MKLFLYILLNFFLLFFFTASLTAQELPPIEKFTPEDYTGDNQNWMITQAGNKFIYAANNEGLLEFNGAKWKLYPSPNSTIIRAVNVINDRIYTGCYMEFGYWEKDVYGELHYNSLIPSLNEKMVDDEHIWNIIEFEEWILFQSHNRVYFYDTVNHKFRSITFDNLATKVFNVDRTIYYHVMNEGIYVIDEGESKLLSNESQFRDDRVINIFSTKDGLRVLTRATGFYNIIDKKTFPWLTDASNVLNTINLFSGIQLRDKSFVLGSISNGIFYLSEDGIIQYQINQNSGLSNNTALSLFEDKDENVWVGLDNGINCVNIKSPVRIFNDDKGQLGTVYSSVVFNNFLYLGTNQGLFYKKIESTEPFKFIKNTAGQVWNLFIYNDELFCGHHFGTYIIENQNATLISDVPGTWGFRSFPHEENKLLQGNYNGLNILNKEDGKWKLKNKIEGFDFSARYFELNRYNEIYVSHGYKGIFKLMVDDDFTKVTNTYKDSLQIGKNSSLTKFKNKLLYAYNKGVFVNDTIKKAFVKDTILSTTVTDASFMSGKLVVDKTQKLWAFSKDNISYVTINSFTNQFKINKVSIPVELRKGKIGYENVSHLENNRYLFGTSNGYLILNLSRINTNSEYNIAFNSIVVKGLDKPDFRLELNLDQILNGVELQANQNSIVFNFSVPEYDKYQIVKYQYKLDGRYNKWSDWTTDPQVTFDNLRYGDYKFAVRAKIGNTLTDNIAHYNFIIMRPWYLSNMALIIYLLSFLMISFIIHKAYKRYYNKQHLLKQSANEKLIVRIKNEKLEQDIEGKNRELAISTMSIIKKNEVLHNIKKELKKGQLESDGRSVIKLIDKNLTDSKDWKFFEDAFNNADKDFLDKIKNLHPKLTPNDLRFSTYLRLNLSSKEIAPLLNISVKSVETRRYRLRKKMNLSHEESLVSYILDI